MSKWMLELTGDSYDARALERFLPSEVTLEQDDGRYWLVLDDAVMLQHGVARAQLSRILCLCNPYVPTRDADFRRVNSGVLRHRMGDGSTTDYVTAEAAVSQGRAYPVVAYRVEDGPPPPPAPDIEWWDLVEDDSRVSNTLECWSNGQRDWSFRCWDVYERIRDDLDLTSGVRLGRGIITRWMGEDPQERFGPSVNHYRHAGKDQLPPNPMGETEACEFVRRLLRKWLDHKMAGRAQALRADRFSQG